MVLIIIWAPQGVSCLEACSLSGFWVLGFIGHGIRALSLSVLLGLDEYTSTLDPQTA